MMPAGNSGDQKSVPSVTKVLLPGLWQIFVSLVCLQLFIYSIFRGNPEGKRLAHILM